MPLRFGLRWQIALVFALFVGSLAVLLSTSLAALWLPGRRQEDFRVRLIAASHQMAEAAALLDDGGRLPPPHRLQHRLADITRAALADLPAEGGFYLATGPGEFLGYAFPNDPAPPPEVVPPPTDKPLPRPKPKGKAPPPAPPPRGQDPPKKEHDIVLAQVLECLNREPDLPPIVQVRDVPPSRVLIVTGPVGRERPARLAVWSMIRLTSPEQQAADLRRTRVATGLALAGIVLSLVLTVNLGRSLHQERTQRERLREELRRSEHLASLGKLLAGVAHEVRNPLAAIRSTVQLWQRLPESARTPSSLDPILHAVDRLNALVGRLLFFVRGGQEERRFLDLNAVVAETLALLRAQAETQGVVLQSELAPELPHLTGSAQALQQVVLNLTTNALQAMPKGGTLLCRTRLLDGPWHGHSCPWQPPGGARAGMPVPRVELCVADTGLGVAPADRAHLFEPFFTTREEGTGLGLALCREIVQQHGGQIELETWEGWGAAFRVTLPLGEPLAA